MPDICMAEQGQMQINIMAMSLLASSDIEQDWANLLVDPCVRKQLEHASDCQGK